MSKKEICRNPWDRSCKSAEIILYILYRKRERPICRNCWSKIGDSDLEW